MVSINKNIKTPTLKKLKKTLDKWFSLFIRQRYAKDDIAKCVTCGKYDYWKQLQCGHYVSRRYLSTRWDEKNCQVQCVGCNLYHEGNKTSFAAYLVRTYGITILEELEAKKNNLSKLDAFEYGVLIDLYKQKVNEL